MKYILLPTDALLYLLVIVAIGFIIWSSRFEHLRAPWRQVFRSRVGMFSLVFLAAYVVIGLLDSVHFQPSLSGTTNGTTYYSSQVVSLLDEIISPLGQEDEESYSQPFATHLFSKSIIQLPDGSEIRDYPRLIYGGKDLKNLDQEGQDIAARIISGTIYGLSIWVVISLSFFLILSRIYHQSLDQILKNVIKNKDGVAWRELMVALLLVILIICIAVKLAAEYHILGTDKVGYDVFYLAIKSIRTGLVVGTLTTLVMLPFAIFLGITAGYFGGRIDDVVQYIYTTLSSIPGVLLITAAILSLQIFIENHPAYFSTLAMRADVRLLALCVILGIASWTSLCRLLRAETLKLREMDFVTAARALGSKNQVILFRHILPNVMHIVLITLVLDFSGLVLAEAVLSYVGVGVDPSSISWGNMINSARLELSRQPMVWWPLLASFIFMFTLVLSANLFADAVRDAFDPRIRHEE